MFGRHSASQGIFVTEMDKDKPLRIPAPLRHHVEQLFTFTDPFCGEHLDAEYAELIRKLIAKLARKRPSPLVRGGQLDPEFCRRELFASNPMSWMILVGGVIVDVRTMPPEVQAEAWRRGLIPDHPARPGDE